MILALSVCIVGQKPQNQKPEEIKGIVIAEYRGMLAHACYHVCGLSLVVKLDKLLPARFVLVHVEYMDVHSLPRNGLPVQLVEKAARWKFDATPNEEATPLQKYVKFIDQNGKDVSDEAKLLAWELLKGAESESLPYGKPLETFSVKVGKFKSIK